MICVLGFEVLIQLGRGSWKGGEGDWIGRFGLVRELLSWNFDLRWMRTVEVSDCGGMERKMVSMKRRGLGYVRLQELVVLGVGQLGCMNARELLQVS